MVGETGLWSQPPDPQPGKLGVEGQIVHAAPHFARCLWTRAVRPTARNLESTTKLRRRAIASGRASVVSRWPSIAEPVLRSAPRDDRVGRLRRRYAAHEFSEPHPARGEARRDHSGIYGIPSLIDESAKGSSV